MNAIKKLMMLCAITVFSTSALADYKVTFDKTRILLSDPPITGAQKIYIGGSSLSELDKDGALVGSVSLGGSFNGSVIEAESTDSNHYFGSSNGEVAKLDSNMTYLSTIKPSTTPDGVVDVVEYLGDIYILLDNDRLYKYNASGSKLFEKSIGYQVRSMEVTDGKILIGAIDGYLETRSTSTGGRTSIVLFSASGKRISKIKAIGNGKALATSWDGNAYEVNVSNGAKSRTYNVGGFLSVADIKNSLAYIGSGSTIKKLDLSTGSVENLFSFGGNITDIKVDDADNVYGTATDNTARKIDKNGGQVWLVSFGNRPYVIAF